MAIDWTTVDHISLNVGVVEKFPRSFFDLCEAAGLPRPKGLTNSVPQFIVELTPDQWDLCEKLGLMVGKPITSPEAMAVRDKLGSGSPEWAAVIAEREKSVKVQREVEYLMKTDKLLIDLLASADPDKLAVSLGVDKAAYQAWLTERQKIINDYPY
jgi:hypothetical protein